MDKFSNSGISCVLLGYPPDKKGYKLLDLWDKSIFTSRDVSVYMQPLPVSLPGSTDSAPRYIEYAYLHLFSHSETVDTSESDSVDSHDSTSNDSIDLKSLLNKENLQPRWLTMLLI